MDFQSVTLIGVMSERKPDGSIFEGFVYTCTTPTNLWCSVLCDDGSRMSTEMVANIVNLFIQEDKFDIGDTIEYASHAAAFICEITEEVSRDSVEAYSANTPTVHKIVVKIKEYFQNPLPPLSHSEYTSIFNCAREQYAAEGVTDAKGVLACMKRDAPEGEFSLAEWEALEIIAAGYSIIESAQ